jgi:6-phosphofructokinase 1
LADVERVYKELGQVVVAVSEGITRPDGEPLFTAVASTDAFGHKQLGGVSVALADAVKAQLGLKARFEKPDTLQRAFSACVSDADREEAFDAGAAAVEHAVAGASGQMVTLVRESNSPYRCTVGLVDAAQVANAEKKLPDSYLSENGTDVTQAFFDYARPLIGAPLPEYGYLF